MDDLVKQAMAKWPNVPDCYGWLGLDERGHWYLRDDAAQASGSFQSGAKGSLLRHDKLIEFIHRNYARDAQGAWYFQNGPQRVYVDLAATPFIARTDGADGLVLHDRAPLATPRQVWMTEQGQMIFQNAHRVAMLDDRDIVQCLPRLRWRGSLCDDSQLLDWLEAPDDGLCFLFGDQALAVGLVRQAEMATTLGFIARPRLDAN